MITKKISLLCKSRKFIISLASLLVILCFNLKFERLNSKFNHFVYNKLCQKFLNAEPIKQEIWALIIQRRYLHGLIINLKNDDICKEFRKFHGIQVQINKDEEDFPLAYAINVYEDIVQVARLLRLIYRPHNLYCIHVDAKAPDKFWNSIIQLAKCFGSNVILVNNSERINVLWGHYSLLESVLVCAKLLIQNPEVRWRYMLNVNGKEMPLKTNWELVRAIRALNGSNMAEAFEASNFQERLPNVQFTFNFTWVKGSFLTVLRREFVSFMLNDYKALEILNAFKKEQHLLKIPDEWYFATLAFNPHLGAPGSCMELKYLTNNDTRTYFLSRYVIWGVENCPGSLNKNGICILGIKDLPILVKRPELFANKFYSNYEPIAYDCLEDWLINKMIQEWKTSQLDPSFNVTLYSELYCSKNHLEPV